MKSKQSPNSLEGLQNLANEAVDKNGLQIPGLKVLIANQHQRC